MTDAQAAEAAKKLAQRISSAFNAMITHFLGTPFATSALVADGDVGQQFKVTVDRLLSRGRGSTHYFFLIFCLMALDLLEHKAADTVSEEELQQGLKGLWTLADEMRLQRQASTS